MRRCVDWQAENTGSTLRLTLKRLWICIGLCVGIGLIGGLCSSLFHLFTNRYLALGLYRLSIGCVCSGLNTAVFASACLGVLLFILSRVSLRNKWSLSGAIVLAIDAAILAELFFLLAPLRSSHAHQYVVGGIAVTLFIVLLISRAVREAKLTSDIRNHLVFANIASLLIWLFSAAILRRSNSYMLNQVLSYLPKGLDSAHVLRFVLGINLVFGIVLPVLKRLFERGRGIFLLIFVLVNMALPLITVNHFEKWLVQASAEPLPKGPGVFGLWQFDLSETAVIVSNLGFFFFSLAAGLFAFLCVRGNVLQRITALADRAIVSRVIWCFLFASVVIVAAINAANLVNAIGDYASPDRPNIILISIDTLRADHLGCYGYKRETSPNIDRLAEKGVTFKNTITPVNATSPSHVSILTSLYPIRHGVRRNCWLLDESLVTFAEYLRNFGYTTAAFVSHYMLEKKYGYSQGFQTYDDSSIKNWRGAVAEDTTKLVLPWIERNYRHKFFLFIHYYDPHLAYVPPEPYNTMFDSDYEGPFSNGYTYYLHNKLSKETAKLPPREVKHIVALYDSEVRYVDENIGKIVDFLDKHGLIDKTLIIVTSDHGEGMYEHGYFSHGWWLYKGELLVPLVMSCPGLLPEGVEVKSVVELIDIFPTVTKLVLDKTPRNIDGMDLTPLIAQPDREYVHPCYSENHVMPKYKKYSVVKGKWKYVCFSKADPSQGDWLFDLESDPGETQNVIERHSGIKSELNALLNEWLQTAVAPATFREELDKERIEQLKALGYIH